ncbi:MAG: winged helix-turn-helix domain-containing protein [Thermoanaerobaculia bacterium]|nr:winged helix-turn-helix domain-containing protein [Thermoanaerobaculia bacterium]
MRSTDHPASGRGRRAWRLGEATFDSSTRDLSRSDGVVVRLTPKVARLVERLLEGRGHVVSRRDLCDALWGERFVDSEQGLNFLVSRARRALGDDASRPRFIETVRGTGYRFVGTAEPITLGSSDGRAHSSRATAVALRWGMAALLLLMAGLGSSTRAPSPIEGGAQRAWPSPAFDLYAQGRYLEERGGVPDLEGALARYEAALAIEPLLVEARAGRAMTWQKLGLAGSRPVPAALLVSREEARKALEISPRSARAQIALGISYLYLDFDPASALSALERAVDLSPDSGEARLWLARAAAASGQVERSVREVEAALRSEPGSPRILPDQSWFYYLAGRYEEAVASARRVLDLEPESWPALEVLHLSYLALDRPSQARQVGERIAAVFSASNTVPSFEAGSAVSTAGPERHLTELADLFGRSCDSLVLERARLLALAGRSAPALELLEEGLARRLWWSPYVAVDPAFEELRDDPRFGRVIGTAAGAPRST